MQHRRSHRHSTRGVLALLALAAYSHNPAMATDMTVRSVNAADAPQPAGGYTQAVEVHNARRILFISGQIPVDVNGTTPTGFAAQCRLVWANIAAQLRAAGMSLDNLVKVTTFLSDRRHAAENSRIRRELLGERMPALTHHHHGNL